MYDFMGKRYCSSSIWFQTDPIGPTDDDVVYVKVRSAFITLFWPHLSDHEQPSANGNDASNANNQMPIFYS